MEAQGIPFNRSILVGREMEYISRSLATGQIAGDQTYSRLAQTFLEELLGVRKALVTTSCTHALEMTALLLDIGPGDEVIIPSFTFVSTANAFALRGARLVFADVRPDTFNLDESALPDLITVRTKAIVPVHYAGVACEMMTILHLARDRGIPVIEDNAHGLFGSYHGRPLGSFGTFATQSFHETKNVTCGEGGALLINDPTYIERAEVIREKGTDRSKFFRGQVDKYGWVDIGSSYVMSDLLAAFLYGQLEAWQLVQGHRARVWNAYHKGLANWCRASGVRQPIVPEHCGPAYHMYYLLMPSLEVRTAFISHMRRAGILVVFHYQPLDSSAYAERWSDQAPCPITADVSRRLVRLPFYNLMSAEEQERVMNAVLEFKV